MHIRRGGKRRRRIVSFPFEGSDENLVSRTYEFTLFAFIRLSIYLHLPFEGSRVGAAELLLTYAPLISFVKSSAHPYFPLRQGGFIKILIFVNTSYIFGIRYRVVVRVRVRDTYSICIIG